MSDPAENKNTSPKKNFLDILFEVEKAVVPDEQTESDDKIPRTEAYVIWERGVQETLMSVRRMVKDPAKRKLCAERLFVAHGLHEVVGTEAEQAKETFKGSKGKQLNKEGSRSTRRDTKTELLASDVAGPSSPRNQMKTRNTRSAASPQQASSSLMPPDQIYHPVPTMAINMANFSQHSVPNFALPEFDANFGHADSQTMMDEFVNNQALLGNIILGADLVDANFAMPQQNVPLPQYYPVPPNLEVPQNYPVHQNLEAPQNQDFVPLQNQDFVPPQDFFELLDGLIPPQFTGFTLPDEVPNVNAYTQPQPPANFPPVDLDAAEALPAALFNDFTEPARTPGSPYASSEAGSTVTISGRQGTPYDTSRADFAETISNRAGTPYAYSCASSQDDTVCDYSQASDAEGYSESQAVVEEMLKMSPPSD